MSGEMHRIEEIKGRSQETKVGAQSASSIYSTPGVAAGTEVSSYSLPQQHWCRRAIQRSQPHRKQGTSTSVIITLSLLF